MVKRRSLSRGLKGTYLALMLAFLYLPIAVMIALSFNESVSRAEWTGFTFKWYAKLLQRQDIIQALNLTVRVAFERHPCRDDHWNLSAQLASMR